MRDNIRIIIRERGKIIRRHEGHNIFVDNGRKFLAELITLITQSPDIPERDDRIKFMGFGIGGVGQLHLTEVAAPPLSDTYPSGSDPNATTGNEYDDDFPVLPLISTLERPVRLAGTSLAYGSAPATDQWRTNPGHPQFFMTRVTTTEIIFRGFLDGGLGDFIYGPYTSMPISEMGLFTSASTSLGVPFDTLVAYHTFGTILVTNVVELEIAWRVNF